MPNEGFLQRWSRLKAEPAAPAAEPAPLPAVPGRVAPESAASPLPAVPVSVGPWSAASPLPAVAARVGRATAAPLPAVPASVAPETAAAAPTLADAALLDSQSDYAAFVARGVDADVRRLAMKKLFADPHFNVIDGLDIYMADYNVPSPVSAAMLASLSHAKSVFARIDELIGPAAGEAAPPLAAAAPATDAPAPSLATAAPAAAAPAPSLTTAAPAAAAPASSLTTAAPAIDAPAPPPPDQEVA